jgi:5-formyltetrahydrofolate cyclo-ligase
MPDTPLKTQKKLLRDHARSIRSSLSPAQVEEKSACICRLLLNVLDGIDPVMVYVSKPMEVNTKDLIEHLISRRKRVIVPVIEKDTRTLRLSYIENTSVLVKSTFHVHEPVGNEIPARPGDVKVAVVPILAFDQSGNRLGYGAGYYDRFLSDHPHIKKIGLAFTCLETEHIPREANDIKMDMIVTENGIRRCDGCP